MSGAQSADGRASPAVADEAPEALAEQFAHGLRAYPFGAAEGGGQGAALMAVPG